ncbi:MAG TPA: DNA polymerase ligase N-terminal domain-containing protein [Gemmatimonadales bacterium]|jgi:bifunctional non-homologous end joining protein LigD
MATKTTKKPAKKTTAKSAKKSATARSGGIKAAGGLAGLGEYRRKRDFSRTAEPVGGASKSGVSALRYVIQKHAATSLHFDLRLELDGVMKSWAVPKGPSFDPSVKRLAMQVEDHPIEYNTFEGTIPKGEYGGGTVMLWDRGVYTYWQADTDPPARLREGYAKGDFKFVVRGKRLEGSWVLVRIRRGKPDKPQWLLIKHDDEFARPGYDIVAEEERSVATGRTMAEIAKGGAPARRGHRRN